MALNLVRNSRLFFTTNVNTTTGVVAATGHTNTSTYEIQVLDGFSFSQTTNTETVTINEAGSSPIRGQRSFNTSLAPVDFSFSTYMRPAKPSTNTSAEEGVLWGALTSSTGNGWTETTGATATISVANSQTNQLQKFGLIFVIDNVTYVIDNCAMNQATIDFGLDSIATIAWSGNGAAVRKLAANVTTDTPTGAYATTNFTAGLTGSYRAKNTTANFIANKLSTCSIAGGGKTYAVPLTGGSVTYNNNITFLTPANLGVVNTPITYFTGTRAISGTINAYLKTGDSSDQDTGGLLAAMLADTSNTSPNYAVTVNIGGASGLRVSLSMPTTALTIPSIDVQQVVSTAINFTAQSSLAGTAGSAFDITASNELTGTYYSS